MINLRENWRGHLWQGRFSSFPMDENYLLATARYIEMNPVRARLTQEPQSWRWSSARAHFSGMDDELVKVSPLLEMAGEWKLFLSSEGEEEKMSDIRRHERTGRPLGSNGFVEKLESILERTLKRQKPGPKKARLED
jgi:putative transposase